MISHRQYKLFSWKLLSITWRQDQMTKNQEIKNKIIEIAPQATQVLGVIWKRPQMNCNRYFFEKIDEKLENRKLEYLNKESDRNIKFEK